MSTLYVDNIYSKTGTSQAIDINSSGVVTNPQKPHVNVDMGGTGAYLPHTTNDALKFDNVFDGDASLFNTSTYKFTCPVDGIYMATAVLLLQNEENISLYFYINSTFQYHNYNSLNRRASAVSVAKCSAGDEIYYTTSNTTSFWDGSAAGGGRYSHGSFTLIG